MMTPSPSVDYAALAAELSEALRHESAEVTLSGEVLAEHSQDRWFGAAGHADLVVFAGNATAVSKTLAFASERGIPLTTRTGGTGYVGGATPTQGGIVLSLARMNRILEIHPADGVAVVEPGVVTGQLQKELKTLGLFYPPDPASLRESTIGGNIATNAGGPRCLKYGVTRAYVLGLEVALADGRLIRTGGRTIKNKTGFDLVGLFTGSEGLLGVVTQATLRLLPYPPHRALVSASLPTVRDAAAAVQGILQGGFIPAALEIADGFTLQAARNYSEREIHPDAQAHLLVNLDGQGDSVSSEIVAIRRLLEENFPILSLELAEGEEESEALWKIRRDFSYALRATGLTKLNEDVVVPRGRLVDLMDFAGDLRSRYGVPVACFGHAGDGNIHVNVMVENYDDPTVKETMGELLDELFEQVLAWEGAITGEHGIGVAKSRWWPKAASPELRAVHRELKKVLDPAGILNPGKFLDID